MHIMFKKFYACIFAIFLSLFLTSCGELGYSLVLWSNSEVKVFEGDIVKVFVRSNISQTYIIQLPYSKQKVEIPLWQISSPDKKSKTVALQEKYSAYAHTYASVKLDGLPIREEPVNSSKQVYRLKQNEIIRVLYKGEGQIPNNGRGSLKGEWLRVLTEGGTFGWCFSYNLSLFERTTETLSFEKPSDNLKTETDPTLSSILLNSWYPEYYSDMIKTSRYDLSIFTENYGLSFGEFKEMEETENPPQDNIDILENSVNSETPVEKVDIRSTLKDKTPDEIYSFMKEKKLKLSLSETSQEWKYDKIKKVSENVYKLDDSQTTITFRSKDFLVLQYTDIDGKTRSENFVSISQNISDLIEDELLRRQEELISIAENGPVFKSSNYGTIIFNNENSVTWKNYKALVPDVISSSALGSATVSIENYISNSLKDDFDGILTFHFIGMEKGINFFYKKESGGIRLEDATKAVKRANYFTSRASSPLVMYFSAE